MEGVLKYLSEEFGIGGEVLTFVSCMVMYLSQFSEGYTLKFEIF